MIDNRTKIKPHIVAEAAKCLLRTCKDESRGRHLPCIAWQLNSVAWWRTRIPISSVVFVTLRYESRKIPPPRHSVYHLHSMPPNNNVEVIYRWLRKQRFPQGWQTISLHLGKHSLFQSSSVLLVWQAIENEGRWTKRRANVSRLSMVYFSRGRQTISVQGYFEVYCGAQQPDCMEEGENVTISSELLRIKLKVLGHAIWCKYGHRINLNIKLTIQNMGKPRGDLDGQNWRGLKWITRAYIWKTSAHLFFSNLHQNVIYTVVKSFSVVMWP